MTGLPAQAGLSEEWLNDRSNSWPAWKNIANTQDNTDITGEPVFFYAAVDSVIAVIIEDDFVECSVLGAPRKLPMTLEVAGNDILDGGEGKRLPSRRCRG